MANVITNIFREKELRKRVFFTLFILIVYRIGAHVPIPGINIDALQDFFDQASKNAMGGFINFFDLFAGGALKRFTVFALGIMPYISSSIIMQLLKVVVPSMERLVKEGGNEGQKKIQKYTKYLTLVLCIVQSTFIIKSMQAFSKHKIISQDAGVGFFIIAVLTITTGTMILMWLGEIITEKGIGNGISLIIFAGIIVRVPGAVIETAGMISRSQDPIMAVMLVLIFVGVIAASILLTLGRRNIPIQYGKRQIGGRAVNSGTSVLPIPLNAGNVIPIIFASSLMMFPSQILGAISQGNPTGTLAKIQVYLSHGQPLYFTFYCLLIIFFSFFYAAIALNPEEVSNNLKKHQGFIPGIRPGATTSEYLMQVLNRITLSGAFFLAFIAVVPDFILKLWPEQVSASMAYIFGGTSLLIIVGVALDTLKQIESHLLMRHYDGFFKKGKIKSSRS